MHESESHSVVYNSLGPHGLYSTWNSPGQNTGVGSLSLLQGIFPTQGSNPGLPHCRADSLPTESPGKSKNTRVGSLSLLQWIFLTQKSNWGLLHCRWILNQLSYQRSQGEDIRIQIITFGKGQSWVSVMDTQCLQFFVGLGKSPGEGIGYPLQFSWASLVAQLVENLPAVQETWVQLGLGRSPGEGQGYPLQYSGLENSMDCIVHGVAKSWTRLSNFHFHFD